MHKSVFVTHHKTGHHLCARLARAVSKELNLNYYDLSWTSDVPDDADVIVYESSRLADQSGDYKFESWGGDLQIQNLDFKGVHLVRHPYEIIASAYRWHQKIDRPWVEEEWENTGKSYKEHLQSEDGIAFEMKNVSRQVIMNIYKFPFSDPRFINVKLEELEENYSSTIVRIARHLGIPEDVMLKTSMPFDLKTMTDYPEYVTREKLDVHSNSALFKPHHYRLFSELFPADLLSRLGYDS